MRVTPPNPLRLARNGAPTAHFFIPPETWPSCPARTSVSRAAYIDRPTRLPANARAWGAGTFSYWSRVLTLTLALTRTPTLSLALALALNLTPTTLATGVAHVPGKARAARMTGSSVHAGLATTVVAVVRRQLRSVCVPPGSQRPPVKGP